MAHDTPKTGWIERLADWIIAHSSLRLAQVAMEQRLTEIEEHALVLLDQRVEALEKIPAAGYLKQDEEKEEFHMVHGYVPFSQRKRNLERRLASNKIDRQMESNLLKEKK